MMSSPEPIPARVVPPVPECWRRVGTSGLDEGRRMGGSVDLGQQRFGGAPRQIGA